MGNIWLGPLIICHYKTIIRFIRSYYYKTIIRFIRSYYYKTIIMFIRSYYYKTIIRFIKSYYYKTMIRFIRSYYYKTIIMFMGIRCYMEQIWLLHMKHCTIRHNKHKRIHNYIFLKSNIIKAMYKSILL